MNDKELGEMFPITVAVAICQLFLLLAATEFFKLMITASGVKDAYEEAVSRDYCQNATLLYLTIL